MKHPVFKIQALIISLCLLAGCAASDSEGGEQDGEERISVVAAIFPAFDFTREIGGGNIDLTMLLPPGTESHSFDPTPKDIITIQNCDLFIYVGGESDAWVEGILDSIDTSGISLLSMMDVVTPVSEEIKEGMEHEHEQNEAEEEAVYDEHVWTSPVNAALISEAIAEALCALDEKNAEAYRSSCSKYIEKLYKLDDVIRNTVQGSVRKTLVFGDRFPFRYFVLEYGLDYFAAFPGCAAETEANAKTITFLIDKVNAEKLPVVFYIEFSNGKTADIICESTGAKKLLLHSCHNVTLAEFEGGMSYLELMTRNVQNLKEALK